MEKEIKLFVNSPNAIDENREEVCDSASAKFRAKKQEMLTLLEQNLKSYQVSLILFQFHQTLKMKLLMNAVMI
ncbi:MAG: hypothetical protein ACLT2Z_09335 [Eubacterium sp.]